jgi:hypothetical protein
MSSSLLIFDTSSEAGLEPTSPATAGAELKRKNQPAIARANAGFLNLFHILSTSQKDIIKSPPAED